MILFFVAMTTLTAVILLIVVLLRQSRATSQLQRQLQQDLHAFQRQFHDLARMIPDALLMIRQDGVIEMVNEQAATLFGYRQDELRGQAIEILIPTELRAQHRGHRQHFFATPQARPMAAGRPLQGQHKNGEAFSIRVSLGPIQTNDGPLVACMVYDIREQLAAETQLARRAAELARSNQELDCFAYIASHDLRAPLRSINQLASWLEEDSGDTLSDKAHDYLRRMRGRIQRMDKLLQDLLAYSRLDRLDTPRLEHIDTAELARDAFEMASPRPGLRLQLSENLPVIHNLRVPLEQILRNLIGNAVKHHDRPEGTIRVSALEQNGYHLFTVGDDGPGIRPELHEKAFAMFQTLRPRDEVEGSGMGLATVRKIVSLYGGEVSLHSDGIRGTAVCFSWPTTSRLQTLQGSEHDISKPGTDQDTAG